MLGNILITLLECEETETYTLVRGKKGLVDFLLHYDDEVYRIVDIDILSGDIGSGTGVEEFSRFIKGDFGLEFGTKEGN